MTYRDIPVVSERPEWCKALSQPLRELVTGDDNEQTFGFMLRHFANRNAEPDVAARWNGLLMMGAP